MNQLRHTAIRFRLVPVKGSVIHWCDYTAGLNPSFDGFACSEELHYRTNLRTVVEHSIDIPSYKNRLAVLLINWRQVEPVVVLIDFGCCREEAGNKVTHQVEPSLRRVVEHWFWSIPKRCSYDRLRSAVYIIFVHPNFGHQVNRMLHLRGSERQFAFYPFVIVLRCCCAKHNVLDPVCCRPACCCTTLDTDGPSRISILGNLLSQSHHFIPSLWNFVACFIKLFLRIPHKALHVTAVPDPCHDFAVFAVHHGHIQPALVVVLFHFVLVQHLGQVYNFTRLGNRT
ncbi:hypothetical protein D3C81_1105010 [compost metagenome]